MNDIVGYQNLIAKIDAVLGAEIGGTGGSNRMGDYSANIENVQAGVIGGKPNAANVSYARTPIQ